MPAPPPAATPRLGPVRGLVALAGEALIFLLIRLFGKRTRADQVPWLLGPIGGATIGGSVYEDFGQREGLTVERHAEHGGLLPQLAVLTRDGFDAEAVSPIIRDFYQHTGAYRMHLRAKAYFPMSLGLWLMVTTLSRKVNQLQFPLDRLDEEREVESEVVLLRDAQARVKWTGWYRAEGMHTLYAGFYTWTTLSDGEAAIKVVFPTPAGNATVLLRPFVEPDGSLVLRSWAPPAGGQSPARVARLGFYRLSASAQGELWVWEVRSLREEFRLTVSADGSILATHRTRFLGLPVLDQFFRIERR